MIYTQNPPVITGVGVATSIGIRKATFIDSLENGVSGLSYIDRFDIKQLPVKKAFLIREKLDYNDESRDPYINFALHAAGEAIKDSELENISDLTTMMIASSSKGGMTSLHKATLGGEPLAEHFENFFLDRANIAIAKEFGLKGPALAISSACTTGLQSILRGANAIHYGECDVSLAGASDASVTPLMLAGYNQMRVYSRDDMRPFDRRRSGFIIGEGAGMMMLEREDRAKARDARIYAKIRGYLLAQDSGLLHHSPRENILSDAITRLLKEADIEPRHIDLINLHGTSTLLGDKYEATQLKRAFGGDLQSVHATANKSMIGHMLGAAGAVESIATALSCYTDTVYPTINSKFPAKFATLNYNYNRLTRKEIRYALKISMGFGGHVAIMLLER